MVHAMQLGASTADVAAAIGALLEFGEGHALDLDRIVLIGHGTDDHRCL